ncbi:PIG-L family deacetylase [Marivirga sp.]|uniref:PIG-L family deacetylase n=1 Tax=Marivirga sp. TaxID=2018662 RepID=UPI0025E5DB4A|nr:PIG-L family deacetylase [Marivirga sp.]
MKCQLLIISLFCVVTISSCKKEQVTQYAPIEQYPVDSILNSIDSKRAMIITAHDDDMALSSGTVSKLNKEGWEIVSVCFKSNKPDRNSVHIQAAKHVIDSVIFIEFTENEYRNDLDDGRKGWSPIPGSEFNKVFNYQKVEKSLLKIVNRFDPTVVFTLDHEYGGYGHPDHIFMSKLVLDLAKEKKIKSDYIYQSVMTPHMEKSIIEERHSRRMESWGYAADGWKNTRELYEVDGMPDPTVQVYITSEAKNKMKYLRSYNERERKTMGFFIPAFEEYEAEEYFKIFDREFFRIIKIENL